MICVKNSNTDHIFFHGKVTIQFLHQLRSCSNKARLNLERQSQHPSPQGLQTFLSKFGQNKEHCKYSLDRQCDVGVFWKLDIVSGSESPPSFFRWSLEKHCKWQRSSSRWSGAGMFVIIYCRRNYSFSLRQNISNLCQSIFVFLTVYYDKIFKHWPESSSIRLRVSFFIAFVHK